MPAAARVDDPITHTQAHHKGIMQMLEGAAVGALIGVALVGVTVLTGGADLLVIGAAVAAGGTVLSMGGKGFLQGVQQGQQQVEKHGQVKTGSANVTINRLAAAAACLSTVECDEHSGPQKVAQGSRTVTINGRMASRVGDRTVCDAVLGSGSANVTIGGETGQCAAINREVADWETGLAKGAIIVGTIAQFVGLVLSGVGIAGAIGAASGVARAVLLARTGVGLLGSFGVGGVGAHYGGKWFGEGSWQQEGMGSAGAILGGGLFGKMTEGFGKVPAEVPAEVLAESQPPGGVNAEGANTGKRGITWFNETGLGYMDKPDAVLGPPGGNAWFMPEEDAQGIQSVADVARETGMAPGAARAYAEGGDIYGLNFPLDNVDARLPTEADAGSNPNWLPGGRTAVRMGEPGDPNGGYLVNQTREFVMDGGNPPPSGSVLFQLMPDGSRMPLRNF